MEHVFVQGYQIYFPMKKLPQLFLNAEACEATGTTQLDYDINIALLVLFPPRHATEQSQLFDAILVGKLFLISPQTVDDLLGGFHILLLLVTGTKIRISE